MKDKKTIFDTEAAKLVSLFDGDEQGDLWQEDELSAIFSHQLTAPVEFDLSQFDKENARKIRIMAESSHLVLKNYKELFLHPAPPLELLEMVKVYAKYCMVGKESVIPKEVAAVLYYVSIAVAAAKCGKKITNLSKHDLKQGFEWVLAKDWVDKDIKNLLQNLNNCKEDQGDE